MQTNIATHTVIQSLILNSGVTTSAGALGLEKSGALALAGIREC